ISTRDIQGWNNRKPLIVWLGRPPFGIVILQNGAAMTLHIIELAGKYRPPERGADQQHKQKRQWQQQTHCQHGWSLETEASTISADGLAVVLRASNRR